MTAPEPASPQPGVAGRRDAPRRRARPILWHHCRIPMSKTPTRSSAFDIERFLPTVGRSRRQVTYRPGQVIFAQGDVCTSVMYAQSGRIKLSVLSGNGKEAVLAMFGPG